jgi:thiol-disulfide isomerase/thioredoxin
MKTLLSLFVLFTIAVFPASADNLTWNDLVNKPELRPAQCSVKEIIQFQSGTTLKPGQKLDILEINANEIVLSLNGNNFSLEPQQTDAVAAANAAYAKLTPKQRELTYATILQRPDLWSFKLKVKDSFDVGNLRIKKGDTVYLMDVKGGKLAVAPYTMNMHFEILPQDTDILEQARQHVEKPNGAPGILAEEMEGKLINAITGQPFDLDLNDLPQYYVLYQGARWCPYCQEFTPKLLKVYQQMRAKNKSFEVYYIPSEKSAAETQQFAKELNFPWPVIGFQHKDKLVSVGKVLGRNSIPNAKVMDRYGKILLDNRVLDNDVFLAEFVKLLEKSGT